MPPMTVHLLKTAGAAAVIVEGTVADVVEDASMPWRVLWSSLWRTLPVPIREKKSVVA